MFVVLHIGSSGRHPWVRQGTEEVTLLWPLCPGLEMLEWFGWDCTSEASHHLCMESTGAERPRWLPYSHGGHLGWDGWTGTWARMAVCYSLGFLRRWSSRGTQCTFLHGAGLPE